MSPGDIGRDWNRMVILTAGGGCSLLGLVVLLGWYRSAVALTQLSPALPPMQPTTALSFLLCGAGLIAIVMGRLSFAAVFGHMVAAIAALTAAQHLSQPAHWHLDRILIDIVVGTTPAHLGQMAPTTALCFIVPVEAI